jgi:hypothetical protein
MVILLGPHHEGLLPAADAGVAATMPVKSIDAIATADIAAVILRRRIIFLSFI